MDELGVLGFHRVGLDSDGTATLEVQWRPANVSRSSSAPRARAFAAFRARNATRGAAYDMPGVDQEPERLERRRPPLYALTARALTRWQP